MGLLRGFWAPFRGALYVLKPGLRRFLVMPVLLAGGLGVGVTVGALAFLRRQPALASVQTSSPVLAWLGLALATFVLAGALFLVLQPVLQAPFCDLLSERIEERVRGTVPKVPFFTSVGRALGHALLKLLLYAVALLLGAAGGAVVPGVGALVGVAAGVLFLAYDGFDYPLARRGAGFGAKWRFLGVHPGLALGYGLGATILYLIPLANLLAPAVCAAGATLAYLDLRLDGGAPPKTTGGNA